MDAAIANHDDDPVAMAAISAELTLEAALVFVDGCSLDSDEEADPVRQQQSKGRAASHSSLSEPQRQTAAPPSPRFFALVDTLENESDSEYVSMEDALKMLDTCEIDDDATEGRNSSGSKTSVVRPQQKTKKKSQKLSFTEMMRAASPSGSSDSDGNNDASGADSSVKSAANGVRKPKQRATAAAAAKNLKKRDAGAKPSAKLRKTAKEPLAAATGADKDIAVKPKKKRVRKQREELLYLREKVVEMQQLLESLQKGDGHSSETTSSNSSTTTAVSSPPSSLEPEAATQQQQSHSFSLTKHNSSESHIASAAWETLAEQQLQERERAEQENRQLKATLEGQIKLVRSLEQLLIGPNDIEVCFLFVSQTVG